MRFFLITGVCLLVIGIVNLIPVAVEMAMKEPVYACSDVTKQDPIDVQKACKK